MKSSLRSALSELGHWTIPGGIVLGSALLWIQNTDANGVGTPPFGGVTEGYPFVVFGASLLLAWRLRRSRIGGAVLAVLLLYALRFTEGTSAPWLPGEISLTTTGVELLMAVGAPVTWILLVLPRDRPIFSRRGIFGPLLGVVIPAATLWTAGRWPAVVGEMLTISYPVPVLQLPARVALVLPVIWTGILLWIALDRREPLVRGLVWSLVAVEIAMSYGLDQPSGELLLMTAGVILGVAVVEGSFRLAYHDDLTGLPGRRALEHALDDLGSTYTLAMVDVDHFKKFNDRHGHDVGDQVLRLVASRLEMASGSGRAFRYGGEEFTLVYPGTEPEHTLSHLEAVRKAVEKARFVVRGLGRKRKGPEARGSGGKSKSKRSKKTQTLSVTVSIGAAGPTDDVREPRAVLDQADKALYKAKKKGRNRVEKA